MDTKNRGGGNDLMAFYEQKSTAIKVMDAKASVSTQHTVAYKQIREDMIRQMGSLHRKRKTEIACENIRIFKKIQAIQDKPSITRKHIANESQNEGSLPSLNIKKPLNKSMGTPIRKLGDYVTGQLPKSLRDEQERIDRQNVKFHIQLSQVRSNIPMNKAVRKE